MLRKCLLLVLLAVPALIVTAPSALAAPLPCAVTTYPGGVGGEMNCDVDAYEVGGGAGVVGPYVGAGGYVCYPASAPGGVGCVNPFVGGSGGTSSLVLTGVCWYPYACDFVFAYANSWGAGAGVYSGSYGIYEDVHVP